ncbi:unnamed protein product [Paramecium sonneborni]|uniref:Uncharacterized protein n=1 Tax=Paramecium sonneborni TaxID=65129 RepID=A0A8S1P662_9CILI|nr:unnamed protein product [Paramecium sonneborni]
MNNSTLISNPRHKQILQIYTSRNYTQPKNTTQMQLKLPNCSSSSKNNEYKVMKHNSFFSPKKQRSHLQSPIVQYNYPNHDSSESFMKDLELSGNEDLKEINKTLLLTSQEINKKMQFVIESYLNNTLKQKHIKKKLNNFIQLNCTHDTSVIFHPPKKKRDIHLQPLRLLKKK